ncbi:Transmembrane protease serine 9 [Trichinella murrelli]|uniref:Transmembrane protease serine 9 n=1 Tax=Trichinella murrelli TaxID=144512 RepID=A0A0V0U292_9BILA|nr:Transmembrane protease serine 9 [Trichinella murrelli]
MMMCRTNLQRMFVISLLIILINGNLSAELYDDGICGRPKFQPKFVSEDNRITGGIEALPHSHPWIVLLTSPSDTEYKCGGTIIPSRELNRSSYILTAAHCVENIAISEIIVTAGMHDSSVSSEMGRQVARVSSASISPEFESNRRYDYAILTLEQPFIFNDYVRSACLSARHEYLKPRTKCLAAGWGATTGGYYKPVIEGQKLRVRLPSFPAKLRQTTLTVHSHSFCEDKSVFSTSYDSKINLCAGDVFGENGINNCDSGGPLICLKEGLWTLYGITKGRSLNHVTQPSYFVQVSGITSFLEEITGFTKYLSRSFKVNDDGICGRPKYQPKFNVSDNRITGGEEAIPHSHPWIVFLSLTHGRKFVCGGVVLQSHEINVTSYVLTAAHCVKNINKNTISLVWIFCFTKRFLRSTCNHLANLIVQAGFHDLTYNTEKGKQVVTVSRIIISDLYMTNYDHDYAVLVLSSPLKFTDYVIPACLSQELENFPLGSKCLIAGWGGIDGGIYKPVIRKSGRNVKSISSRYLVLPKTLMQAVITIIDDNNCSNAFFASYDSAINLCAADAMGVIGINNYDSGGPLVCLKDGLWSLHGMGHSALSIYSNACFSGLLAKYYKQTGLIIYYTTSYDDGSCGRPVFQVKYNMSEHRITGGVEANPHSHPWIVLLRSFHSNKYCGGIILPTYSVNFSSFILTSAHCVYRSNISHLLVLAGVHDIQSLSDEGIVAATVKDVFIHPFYLYNSDYDVAILKLKNPLLYNSYILPACLPRKNEYLKPRTRCLASGWGAIDGVQNSIISRTPIFTTKLMQTEIIIHSHSFCQHESVFYDSYDDEIYICGGDIFGIKGTNTRDSGGPLVCMKSGVWTLYGVVKARGHHHETQPSFEQIKDGNLECGLPKYQPIYEFSENRVTAGVEAIPHSHPWLVFITSKIKDDKCGGAILPSRERNSSSFILTAAHCIFYLRKEEIMVTAGMHDQSLNNEIGRQSADVKRRVINITYKKNKGYDYGILILLQPLKFNDYVKPICICKEREHLMPGTKCLIAGWGAIDGGAYKPIIKNNTITRRQTVFPTVLMQTVLAVYSNAYCANASFFSTGYDSVINLCAGDDLGEKGVNNADSGMPLVCLSEGLWTMYGIARGRSAFSPKQLSLFIQIASITRFINFYTGYLMQGKYLSQNDKC